MSLLIRGIARARLTERVIIAPTVEFRRTGDGILLVHDRFYIWYPPSGPWVYGDDYEDTSGSSVGFSEWQSSGDGIPYDWDYDNASYVVRAWFQAIEPYDDDLYIIIYDGYLSE